MNKEEQLFNGFLQGKIVFMCDSLVSFRSCRKLVRIQAKHIQDNLTEDIFTEGTVTSIGLRVEHNELQLLPCATRCGSIAYAFIKFSKELYQQLLNMQIEQNVVKYNGGNDMLTLTNNAVSLENYNECGMAVACANEISDGTYNHYLKSISIDTVQDKLDRLEQTLREESVMNNKSDVSAKVINMLSDYYKMRQDKIDADCEKQITSIKQKDRIYDIHNALNDRAENLINRMIKNKELEETEAKAFKEFFKSEIDRITYKAEMESILSNATIEKIKLIKERTIEQKSDLREKIQEIKIRVSCVETYEQAMAILETYDIINSYGAFILD